MDRAAIRTPQDEMPEDAVPGVDPKGRIAAMSPRILGDVTTLLCVARIRSSQKVDRRAEIVIAPEPPGWICRIRLRSDNGDVVINRVWRVGS